MDDQTIKRVGDLGRRLALTIGVDPDDGQQEALTIALETITASRRPLTQGKIMGRVHDRILGRYSRLRKCQSLSWQGIFVGTEIVERVACDAV